MSGSRIHYFFQSPVNLAGFFVVLYVLLATTSLSPIKSYVKSVLSSNQKISMSKSESLYQDIVRFTNEQIIGDDVILVFPFGEADFQFYINHRHFINRSTPLYVTSLNPFKYVVNFQDIFENDLNYSIEKLRSGGSWDEIWRSVDEKHILKWRKEYGITHVIQENEITLDFPIVYRNDHYTIYDLRLLENS